jgi:hypothetical protein
MSYTRQQFCSDLAKALGNSNPSSQIMAFLIGWSVEESGHSPRAGYNLWNTTLKLPGSTTFNSAGVQSYATYGDGIRANAQTLNNGLYPSLVEALRTNNAAALGMGGSAMSSGVAGDLSVWVSGSRSPIQGSYISNILTLSRNAASWASETAPGNTSTTSYSAPLQPTQTVDQIFTQRGLWRWYADHVTQGFNGAGELGDDFANSWHTPVATPVAGKVTSITHNNNSVSDVITIVDTEGGTWQYLHQDARVRVGQQVSVGDVIGLENGLPVDQYSTGPHIEVRYRPAGQSYWSDPLPHFRAIGSTYGVSGPGSPTSIISALTAVTQYFNIETTAAQAHAIINQVPGFLGICEALDTVEQFVPFQLPTNTTTSSQQGQQTPIPGVTTVTDTINIFGWNLQIPDIQIQDPATAAAQQIANVATLPSDAIQATLVFVTTNFFAFATRALFVLIGFFLLSALILNIVSMFAKPSEIASSVAPLLEAAA